MDKYVQAAMSELDNKTLGDVAKYLQVDSVVKTDGIYDVAKVEEFNDCVIVYFKIENEMYFLAIVVEIQDALPSRAFILSGNECYFTATSDAMTLGEMACLTVAQGGFRE